MKNIPRKIFFLGMMLSFITYNGYSQIDLNSAIKIVPKPGNKQHKRQNKIINTPSAPLPQEIPVKEETRDELLSYFCSQAKNEPNFYFKSKDEFSPIKLPLDSLLPKAREFVDAFTRRKKTYDSDTLYTKDKQLKYIYEQTNSELKKRYKDRKETTVKEIDNLINALPISREKVGLFLNNAQLYISNSSYYDDVFGFYSKSKKIADDIIDDYEKGKAYFLIGDFLSNYNVVDTAIKTYYLARSFIESSSKSEKIKDYEEGLFNNALATAFNRTGLDYASSVAANYFSEASFCFDKADKKLEGALSYMYSLYDINYVLTDLPREYSAWYSSDNQNKELEDLAYLKRAYQQIRSRGNNMDQEYKYLVYYNIASVLRHDLKFKEALVFYFNAFFEASNGKYSNQLENSIIFLSFTYSMLNNIEQANGYSDLRLFLTEHENIVDGYYYSLLRKSGNFFELKQYDSALYYINALQYDTTVWNYLYPKPARDLFSDIYDLKRQIFESLKTRPDSVYYYNQQYYGTQIESWSNYSALLSLDSYLREDWLEKKRDKEITNFQSDIENIKKEKFFLSSSLNNLTSDFLISKKKNQLLRDSLSLKQRAIDSLKKLANFYDSASKSSKADAAKYLEVADSLKKVSNSLSSEASKSESARNIAITILSLIVLVSLFLGINIRKQLKEKKLLQSTILEMKEESSKIAQENEENNFKLKLEKSNAEMKLLSSLAINHDIEKFIPLLPRYIANLNEENKSKLVNAVEKFKNYYLRTKEIGNSLTNTIKEEIEIARMSSEIFLYIYKSNAMPSITTNFYGNQEIESLEIPKHMLTSLISNSVKHGSIGKESITVSVTVEKQKNGYLFIVEDDGVGFSTLNLENKEHYEGLNLIFNQVKNFNEGETTYKIIFSPKDICNKGSNTGVIVKFKLSKQWQEETL